MSTHSVSYGIALFYVDNKSKNLSMFLVKRKFTYHFSNFINGYYKNDKELALLFNNMTMLEKDLIRTSSYRELMEFVYNAPLNMAVTRNRNNKEKYEKVIFDESLLKKLIYESSNAMETPWELPKGKQHKKEKPVETAIREFFEETKISNKDYVIDQSKSIIENYHDMDPYTNKYFVAFMDKVANVDIKYSTEVSGGKWFCYDELKYLSIEQPIKTRLLSVFSKVKKMLKNKNIALPELLERKEEMKSPKNKAREFVVI